MKLLEDYFPGMHSLGVVHDALVGKLAPGSDVLHPANIPTMPPAYVAGVVGAVVNTVVDIARS